jgi:hypothetical protein
MGCDNIFECLLHHEEKHEKLFSGCWWLGPSTRRSLESWAGTISSSTGLLLEGGDPSPRVRSEFGRSLWVALLSVVVVDPVYREEGGLHSCMPQRAETQSLRARASQDVMGHVSMRTIVLVPARGATIATAFDSSCCSRCDCCWLDFDMGEWLVDHAAQSSPSKEALWRSQRPNQRRKSRFRRIIIAKQNAAASIASHKLSTRLPLSLTASPS